MLKIAFRTILKTKSLSFIQVFGFAIAITTSTILFLTAMFELSFDRFHKDTERIGMVYMESNSQGGVEYNPSVAAPLAPLMKKELPDVENVTRVYQNHVLLRNDNKEVRSINRSVDQSFFNIFDFKLIQGNKKGLDMLDGVILDENTAMSLYGSTNIIGRPIELNQSGEWENRVISAVIENAPSNSNIHYNSLSRVENLPNFQARSMDWGHKDHFVFVKVKSPKLNVQQFTIAAQSFLDTHYKDEIGKLKRDGAMLDKNGKYLSIHLLPLRDLHLSDLRTGSNSTANFPWILLLIAGLIMFIAGSNFVNLSLANSLTRIKEIGTRKTIGGTTFQLFKQLWIESFLICLIGLILGLLLTAIILPEYNATLGYNFSITQLFKPLNIIIFLSSFLLLTVITGGYPAMRISSANIIESLKGTGKLKSTHMQNSLTVLQFAIAIILCIATIVISSQLHYLANRPLGFNKNEVISIPIGSGVDSRQLLARMRVELSAYPWVKSITGTDINLGQGRDGSTSTSRFGFDHEGKEVITNFLNIDYDYLKTLDIKLLAGRDFDRSFGTDSNAVLINKEMAALVGGEKAILGKQLQMDGSPTVIGIVDNFNFDDLKQKVGPLTMSINPSGFPLQYLFVRVETDNLSQTLQNVEKTWKTINPKASFAASYLDENTQNQYKNERRFAKIVIAGASVAIIISCLGLFALTILLINGKIKEIGIRRVLGSSIGNIILLLSKNFIKLISIAFLIGAPISWFIMNNWLQSFAFRIEIQWWMLVLAGSTALGFAMITIAWQTFKAARTNPVDSLRDE
ncbi:FtsX-like permease family protein [Sphingobacterium sp. DK4209]|uniref:FtsX-like permease family protein n=1 Tax=Sphingobacterium zhuxiongii TaxID=2662364 RepID=A0A5Q0Q866_9SPHI|nr:MULTISPECIES: ABC transporter permease [unclassified Sphingobacterium]MVZ66674.1 FtsX-like permease family protein [Sphingobacterium sp. DK4209]QGA25444.1 FtsX-like permease family protein [Sphingobacterium sp. dk4302]